MSTTRPGTPSAKAHRTAHWATTMTRWLIRHSTGGKRAGTRAVKLWQVIGFPGPNGRGSRGIVDLVAIRRDHSPLRSRVLQPGDLFEIVLIQVKGGTAPWPSPRYIKRLRAVQKRYGAPGRRARRVEEGARAEALPTWTILGTNLGYRGFWRGHESR